MNNPVRNWWLQRITAIVLLCFFSVFLYLYFYIFYIPLSLSDILSQVITHPLELLFLSILLFYIFWHSLIGIQIICEDYIHKISLRIFTITVIKFFSRITYITLIFSLLCFYKNLIL
ncbi:succinate dehydrogenase, hydrophobic membrane anchor protein [Wolbachia endosymbiont of Howardula sp.]|uniref:succinate dehydrogenase, hydrophobic membrane anchor protein n=1 Tax=Wolbachia endosymbiont of Howardula sp. TaxID=2916816 RepID=UPI00217DB9DC|nr:succinate dehydrogenase, hydrophobic membrane anchor protein [Wolbachia endosymbiont of Howardula sp.]UWI83128.1 succinate dehydrogenase, hydrophobic membrane anchor protein [Wolbachia endosymbiont of Howardula sp.]